MGEGTRGGAGLCGSLLLSPEGWLMVLCGSDQVQVDADLFWGATGDSGTLFSTVAAQDSKHWPSPLNRGGWEKSLCREGPSRVFKATHGGDKGSAVLVRGPGCARRSERIFYVKILRPPYRSTLFWKHLAPVTLGACLPQPECGQPCRKWDAVRVSA